MKVPVFDQIGPIISLLIITIRQNLPTPSCPAMEIYNVNVAILPPKAVYVDRPNAKSAGPAIGTG
jgi:hypothetical protein